MKLLPYSRRDEGEALMALIDGPELQLALATFRLQETGDCDTGDLDAMRRAIAYYLLCTDLAKIVLDTTVSRQVR